MTHVCSSKHVLLFCASLTTVITCIAASKSSMTVKASGCPISQTERSWQHIKPTSPTGAFFLPPIVSHILAYRVELLSSAVLAHGPYISITANGSAAVFLQHCLQQQT